MSLPAAHANFWLGGTPCCFVTDTREHTQKGLTQTRMPTKPQPHTTRVPHMQTPDKMVKTVGCTPIKVMPQCIPTYCVHVYPHTHPHIHIRVSWWVLLIRLLFIRQRGRTHGRFCPTLRLQIQTQSCAGCFFSRTHTHTQTHTHTHAHGKTLHTPDT